VAGVPVPGDQYDPHVDGDIAAYTSNDNIRYYDFFTGADEQVPAPLDAIDRLSDVSDGKIVYSRDEASGRSPIMVFDTATPGADPIEVDPQLVPLRTQGAIGSDTVAFIDLSLTGTGGTGEVVASQLGGITFRVTNDARIDRHPAVAPSGDLLVYESCETSASNCDIHQAAWNGSSWVLTPLTNNAEPEANPDTDGAVIVYDAFRSGERDIYWQPVGGGIEQSLDLPGQQRNPSVSGGLIAFESIPNGEHPLPADLFVYQIATNRLFRVTSTFSDESLNDVTALLPLSDGQFRLVWSDGATGNRDVRAADFELPDVVGAFTFGGFLQPVEPYSVFNVMKGGAAVPVRFSLGGFRGLDIFAAGYPKSAPITCWSTALETPIDETMSAGGSSLSYDAASDQYSYIWKTEKGWAGTCRQLVIQFSDFSPPNYANFKFK
jgi:hypothetical protein